MFVLTLFSFFLFFVSFQLSLVYYERYFILQKLNQLRNQYNAKIHGELDKIKTLKDKLVSKRRKHRQSEKAFNELRIKNQNIVQPFERVKSEIEQLRLECVEFQGEKKLYNQRKRELKVAEDKLKDLQWRHEVLFQRFEILEKERDEVRSELEKSMLKGKQRHNLESRILEEKKHELYDMLEHSYNELLTKNPSDDLILDADVDDQAKENLVNVNRLLKDLAQEIKDLMERIKPGGEIKSKGIGEQIISNDCKSK